MSLDPKKLLSRKFERIVHSYTKKDSILYSLGIGINNQNSYQKKYIYEGVNGDALVAFPTMVNVLAYPGYWAKDSDSGITWQKLVHLSQEISIYKKIPSEGSVYAENRITGLWDRGVEKGALLEQTRDIYNSYDGQLIATVKQLNLLRADGGFSTGDKIKAPPKHPIPDRAPDFSVNSITDNNISHLYRLSGDMNPLHVDNDVSKSAGFPSPIMHGMCTMGIVARAVVENVLAFDESRISSMKVNFSSVCYPGETLKNEIWIDGKVISLKTTSIDRDKVVIDNSYIISN